MFEVEAMKCQVREDLDTVVSEFNENIMRWEQKHKCRANFRWAYKDDRKELAVSEVVMPIYHEEVSDKDVESVLKEAAEASPQKVKPQ